MTGTSNQRTHPVYSTEFVLVVLWHWVVVTAAIASAAWLYVEGGRDFLAHLLMAALFGWSIWATKAGIAFCRDPESTTTLLQMWRVHRSLEITAGFCAAASLFLAVFSGLSLLASVSLGGLIGVVFLPFVSIGCGVVYMVSGLATRTLTE